MSDIQTILEKQRAYFASGSTKALPFRRKRLNLLKQAIKENEDRLLAALRQDLNKSPFEAYATEIGIVLEEIGFVLHHLKQWASPKRVRTPLTHFFSVSKVYQEPYGSVLLMSPWNYPFQLTIAPLVGAIAAGNCAVLKPSNDSPATSHLICALVNEYFEEKYLAVMEGGREMNRELLEQKFDYIFFTGGGTVGRLVMEAAARHLTPVTLELGGKSPCIVDKTADIDLAAKRIAWGKCLNAGQTCVAPDYIYVQKSVKQELIDKLAFYIRKFYGEEPQTNDAYPKIINAKHFVRLRRLMESGTIVFGGQCNAETLQIAPAILDEVHWDMPIMQEEIFGPLLPVLTFETLEEVVLQINRRPKALALYFFTGSKADADYIVNSISFGGGCINDTIVHLATSFMPFGGVGESGMGAYHGENSFRTFSHSKSILKKSNLLDIPLRYPPYEGHLRILKKVMK